MKQRSQPVAEQLRALIMSGAIAPGEELLEVPTAARLGITVGGLDVSVFANNVLNSHPLLGRFHALAFDDRLQASTLRPRTVGLTLSLALPQ